jgi:hypothetical protein
MVNPCETGSHRSTLVYLFNPSATFGGPQIPSSESGHPCTFRAAHLSSVHLNSDFQLQIPEVQSQAQRFNTIQSASIKLPYSYVSQTQKFPKWKTLHPISLHPPAQSYPNERCRHWRMGPLQLLWKLQDSIPTSHKLIPHLPPSNLRNSANFTWGNHVTAYFTNHTPILVKRTIYWPAGGSSPILLMLQDNLTTTRHSIPFPPLRSPPIFPERGNFNPHLHHHHGYPGQTKRSNTDRRIISKIY